MRKSQDYPITRPTLTILFNLTDHLRKKMKEKIFSLISSGFEKVSDDNTKEILVAVYNVYPKETEAELMKWINKKVITKSEGVAVQNDKLTLGNILNNFGINASSSVLATTNEASLNKLLFVLQSLGSVSARTSDELLNQIVLVGVLAFESNHESVSKSAIKTLTSFFEGFIPRNKGFVPNHIFGKGANKSVDPEWEVAEISNKQRVIKLTEGILFEAFSIAENVMKDGLQADPKEAQSSLQNDIYKLTLAEYVEKDKESRAILKDQGKAFINCTKLINGLFDKTWICWAYARSARLRALIRGFVNRARALLSTSSAGTNPKAREACLNTLIALSATSHLLVFGEPEIKNYMNLLRPYVPIFDKVNMTSKNTMSVGILQNIFQAFTYFYGNEALLNLDTLKLPANLQSYNTVAVQTSPYWLCSQDLENLLIRQPVTDIQSLAVLLLSHFDKSSFISTVNLTTNTWVIFDNATIEKILLQPFMEILSIEQGDSEKYSKTIGYIDSVVQLFLKEAIVTSSHTMNIILKIADEMAKKGQFSKVQAAYFRLTDNLLLWTSLQDSTANIEDLNNFAKKKDDEVTLLDLVQFTTKSLVAYDKWTLEYRVNYLIWVLQNISSKNINKRIVYMSVLLFLNRYIRGKDYKDEKIILDQTPFLNEQGFADLAMVERVFEDIKKSIGYNTKPYNATFTPEQRKELDKFNPKLYPSSVSQYLTLPFEAISWVLVEDTLGEFKKKVDANPALRESLESSLVEYLKLVIMEYSETVDENNLTVKYKYAEHMADTKKRNQATFGRESLIFAAIKQAATYLGLESMKRIHQRLLKEESAESSDCKKVQLIMLCACIGASLRYSDAEFAQLLLFGAEILKPLMNVLNSKHLQTLVIYLTVALKGALNFERLTIFFNSISAMMEVDAPQNKCYYFNVLIFQVSISQLLCPDRIYELVQNALPKLDLEDINTVSTISKVYTTVAFIRYLIAFNQSFAAKDLPQLAEKDLTAPAHRTYYPSIDTNLINYLKEVSTKKLLTRMEAGKTLLHILFIKRIDTINVDIIKQIVGIIFTLDPNEDLGMSQIVQGIHKMVEQIKPIISCTPSAKETVLAYLLEKYDSTNSIECLKSVIKLFKVGFNNEITPMTDEVIMRLAKETRIPLRESVDSFLRYDIFTNLSNRKMYEYAKKVFGKIDSTIAEK